MFDQCLADADASTSPAEDDASRAKKALFVSDPSAADTTSASDSVLVKVNTTEDGIHEDTGKCLVTYCWTGYRRKDIV